MVPALPGPPGVEEEHTLRHMTAAAFQAAQTTGFRHFAIGTRWDPTLDTETTEAPVSSLPVPPSAHPPQKRARMGPQPSRSRYTSKDFAVPFESAETVERWYREHPAVRKKYWYQDRVLMQTCRYSSDRGTSTSCRTTVRPLPLFARIALPDALPAPPTRPIPQMHSLDNITDATAKHFDLRVHLDGQTVSWAVPKGLGNFPLRDSTGNNSGSRLAIETDLHPLSDTLYEGGGIGTKAVWDVGSYRIIPTQSALRRLAEREPDTDEEDEGSSQVPQTDDEIQEDLFCAGYHRGSFKGEPARHGRPARAPEQDDGSSRAFTIELNGVRYQALHLVFHRKSSDVKFTNPRGTARGDHRPQRRPQWMISLATNSKKSRGIEQPLGDISILTSRTMEDIAAARPDELRHCKELGIDPMVGSCGGEDMDGGSWAGMIAQVVTRSIEGVGGRREGGRGERVDEDGFPVYDSTAYSS